MRMSKAEFIAMLADIAERVAADDSVSGSLRYELDFAFPSRAVEVQASYRIGNLQGQGGMTLIPGEFEDDIPF